MRAPRGTADVLPREAALWLRVEDAVRQACEAAGYGEIRTPIFEHTEVFERGVGSATDIVDKEMYTFLDRGGRRITLRPEGTAPVVRAYLEHGLASGPQPVKLYYIGPMFRYERPQAGRYRQFAQFGVEALGSADPAIDAEVMSLLVQVFASLGLSGFVVRLNSIGCPRCRPAYREALVRALRERAGELCGDCRTRLERNPLRVLDCKVEACRAIAGGLPPIFDYLCEECSRHHKGVLTYLDALGLEYEQDPRIVRGLDYYTKTVFEVVHSGLGSQDALGGGGRYDGLAEVLGGRPAPGVGFAAGIERAVKVLQAQAPDLGAGRRGGLRVFVAAPGPGQKAQALRTVSDLRSRGVSADMDYMNRNLKRQLEYAHKLGAEKVVILGEEELASGLATIRDMRTGEQSRIGLGDLAETVSGPTTAVEGPSSRATGK